MLNMAAGSTLERNPYGNARGPRTRRSRGQQREAALLPPVQELRNLLAGGDADNFAGNVASAATGSLLFPGSVPLNLAAGTAGGAAGEATKGQSQGTQLAAVLAASLAAPYTLAKGQALMQGAPSFFARQRLEQAMQQSHPELLAEATKAQQQAARQGTFLLPSQTTARPTSGFEKLETEVMASKSGRVQPLREKVLRQVDDADRIARSFVGDAPGRLLPAEEAAAKVVGAAQDRASALRSQGTVAAEELFNAGNASRSVAAPEQLRDVKLGLINTSQSAPAGSFVQDGIEWLTQRIAKAELAAPKGLTARDLNQIHKDFLVYLDTPNVKGSIIPSTEKEVLRKVSEANVRQLAEQLAPQLREGREVVGQFKAANEYNPFDIVGKEGRMTTTRPALKTLVEHPRIAEELTEGVVVPKFDETGRRMGQQTLAANKEAAQDSLKSAFEVERQRAFERVAGKMNQQAPASLIGAIAPSQEAKEELVRVLSRLGGDAGRAGEQLDVLEALARPTAVRGMQVDTTGISPLQAGLASGLGGPLQTHQARAGIFRALYNRMSDAELARLLQRPDFAEVLAGVPGAKAMTPRAAMAAVLSTMGQQE